MKEYCEQTYRKVKVVKLDIFHIRAVVECGALSREYIYWLEFEKKWKNSRLARQTYGQIGMYSKSILSGRFLTP